MPTRRCIVKRCPNKVYGTLRAGRIGTTQTTRLRLWLVGGRHTAPEASRVRILALFARLFPVGVGFGTMRSARTR